MKPSTDRPHGDACKISGVAIVFPAKSAEPFQRLNCIISSR